MELLLLEPVLIVIVLGGGVLLLGLPDSEPVLVSFVVANSLFIFVIIKRGGELILTEKVEFANGLE